MGKSKSVRYGKVRPDIKMTGKTVLITGANCGLGLATTMDLARREARIIMACRNLDKGSEALEKVVENTGSRNVELMELDLSSMESIRKFASEFKRKEKRLDVLMNNAGICMCPYMKTADGNEMQFGTNHLGHFLLTHLLLDVLKVGRWKKALSFHYRVIPGLTKYDYRFDKSTPSRIVTLSSRSHEKIFGGKIYWDDLNLSENYTPAKGYSQSKLMNVLFSRELSKRLRGTGVTTYCVHPGAVKTDLQRYIGHMPDPNCSDHMWGFLVACIRPWWKSPEEGAQTQIYCAVAPELENESGNYYMDCHRARESRDGRSEAYAERLWEISESYTGIKT